MRRDNDLIRDILLRVEESDGMVSRAGFSLEGYDWDEVAYHLGLLDDAGFLTAKFLFGDNQTQDVFVTGLTWAGHDFLDAIKSDTVWAQTKDRIAGAVGSASLEVVKAVAVAVSLQMLGLQPRPS